MPLATRIGVTVQDLLSGAGLLVTSALSVPTLIMETDKNPVAGGGNQPGWVSGTPAGLAASGTVDIVFDLGPDWDQYRFVQISCAPAGPSSGSQLSGRGSDTTTATENRRLSYANSVNLTSVNNVAFSSSVTVVVRPIGRYVIPRWTNTDGINVCGAASKCTIAAYPS